MESEQVKEIAKTAAKEALTEFMLILGVNLENKDNMVELNKDLTYIRGLRVGREEIVKKTLFTVIGVVITAIVAFIFGHK